MALSTYNFKIDQGSTVGKTFTITSGDLDLSGYEMRMQIRKIPESTTIIWDSTEEEFEISEEVSVDNGGLTIESATVFTLNIPPERSELFSFQTAGYDIEIEKDGVVVKLMTGTITLNREYTK